MMAVARWTVTLSAIVAVACTLVFGSSKACASTPLVTGNLLIYYDFDSFTNTVMDGSGNGFNGKVQDMTRNTLDQPFTLNTTGVITNDTTTFKRGGGAIRFTQSTVAGEDPVFVDMDGGVISSANPGLMPTNAISFAAWVNLTSTASDTSIFQGASAGHGVPHFQVQGGGRIRFTLRDGNGNNLVTSDGAPAVGGHPWPNQPDVDLGATPTPFPINEWHHLAVTYDHDNPAGGQLDMYYDGVKIRTLPNNGPGAAIGTWQLRGFTDFYDGLGLGAVYDSGSRRTNGLLDEAYIFTRKLTDAEILTLYNIAPPGVAGDYNGNGTVDAADYVLWRNGGPLANEVDTPGTVNAADYTEWRARFGNITGSGLGGGDAVPEPTSLGLLFVGFSMLWAARRRAC